MDDENQFPKKLTGDSAKQSIAVSDPLRQYLNEISKIDLLDPEEELALATKLREEGDLDAAKRLVTANLRLVVKIALEYKTIYSNTLDLIQEGNIGLMKAVSKFDPSKGAKLSYYSSWWIRSYILKFLLDNFRLVKLGTTQAQKKLFYHLLKEKEKLEAQGIEPTHKLLAERLEVKESEVVEMESRLSSQGLEFSLDQPYDEDGSALQLIHTLADKTLPIDVQVENNELKSKLDGVLEKVKPTLNEKECAILDLRILAEEPKTLQEIADTYGITRERIRQLENKILEKIRKASIGIL